MNIIDTITLLIEDYSILVSAHQANEVMIDVFEQQREKLLRQTLQHEICRLGQLKDVNISNLCEEDCILRTHIGWAETGVSFN